MIIQIRNKPELGGGIYTLPDITMILDLPKNRANRWLSEYWDGKFGKKRNTKYSWGTGRNKAIGFYSLIEFYTFYQLRKLGVSFQKIFKAHNIISDTFQTPYPFATSVILTDGEKILFYVDGDTITSTGTLNSFFFSILFPF